MPTDVLPETQNHHQSPPPDPRGPRRDSPTGRWWKRGLVAVVALAVLASAAALIPGAVSSWQTSPKLTYTIKRGELVVTVTARGTLESSENTEIKSKVRGQSAVTWVIPSGSLVEPGDELVRLDTLAIENAVSERTKYAHWSRSAAGQDAGRRGFLGGLGHQAGRLVDWQYGEVRHDRQAPFRPRAAARHERRGGNHRSSV